MGEIASVNDAISSGYDCVEMRRDTELLFEKMPKEFHKKLREGLSNGSLTAHICTKTSRIVLGYRDEHHIFVLDLDNTVRFKESFISVVAP